MKDNGKVTHDIFPIGALQIFGALEGKSPEEVAQELMDQEDRAGEWRDLLEGSDGEI